MVPLEHIKSEGNPVSVHKQSHRDDRVWSVFLALSILSKLIILLNFKVIIRTVIVKELPVPGMHEVC